MRPISLYLCTLAVAAMGAFAAPQARADAGLKLNTTPQAADFDLPLYAGATARRDKGDDATGLNFALWGGSLGLRLVVGQYHSGDDVESVAAFYRQALSRFGPVLDCSQGKRQAAPSTDDGQALECDSDEKPNAGGRLYKVGTKRHQRVVHVKAAPGGGADFELVRIEANS